MGGQKKGPRAPEGNRRTRSDPGKIAASQPWFNRDEIVSWVGWDNTVFWALEGVMHRSCYRALIAERDSYEAYVVLNTSGHKSFTKAYKEFKTTGDKLKWVAYINTP